MKKLLVGLVFLCLYNALHAQTTNTFPNTGPVGIGTTSTTSSYPPGISNPTSGSYLEIKSFSDSYPSGLFLRRQDGAGNIGFDLTSDNNSGIIYADSRWNNEASSIRFRMNTLGTPLTVMTLSGNGNVGIGTTDPTYKLQVQGGISAYNGYTSYTTDGLFNSNAVPSIFRTPSNATVRVGYVDAGSGQYSPRIGFEQGNETTTYGKASLGFNPDGRFSIAAGASNTEFMTISTSGNVGIGATDPGSYKLAVNGPIRAKEIKVETGWSDFVFEPDYKLLSLKETEEYIKKNGHLPEIPSAKEVGANGINLGEMNAKLLQKIEELTLHTISQNKMQEALINEVKQLRSEINQFKTKP